MRKLQIRTASEQVADFLKEELIQGTWTGTMPGEIQLTARLGAGRQTVQEALRHLEVEGLLVPQGVGRRRLIQLPKNIGAAPLRIRTLHFEKEESSMPYYDAFRRWAEMAGHLVESADKDLHNLGMNPKRVARYVKRYEADAWVVIAASSDVLEWFAKQSTPAFALFGNKSGIDIGGVGVNFMPAIEKTLDRLVALGHRRIVMLAREDRRKPRPGLTERGFLAALAARGIEPSSYHLPDWEDTPTGLHKCLKTLFAHTPPTTLIIQEARLLLAVQQHLSHKGILAPRDVSLVCVDNDPDFIWCQPQISSLKWNSRPVTRSMTRWIQNVVRGKNDCRQVSIRAEFVQGGTIGKVNHGT